MKDVDGDGCDDLIFTSQGYNSPGYVWIYVATSNGASNFNRKQLWGQIPLDEKSTIVGIGDLNNDGAFDLILNHNSYRGYTFDAWLSNGRNQFTRPLSSWFKIDYIPYGSEIQFIGVANTGLGNWDK